MRTITKLEQIINLSKQAEAAGKKMYIRWSRGPVMDKRQGASMDYTSYQRHNGLSAQAARHDNPKLMAQMLVEYQFLRRKDSKIYCWIFTAQQNGVDSDNAPTVDAESIEPVGKISADLIAKCDVYKQAYQAHRKGYLYNASKPEHHERNAKLDSELKEAWEGLS